MRHEPEIKPADCQAQGSPRKVCVRCGREGHLSHACKLPVTAPKR